MKIMILVGSYPPIINSAARLYSELAESLMEMGHNVTVITQHPGEDNNKIDKEHDYFNTTSSRRTLNDVNVLRVRTLSFLSKVPGGNALRYLLSCLLFGIRGIFTKKPDVILVYSSPLYMGISGYIVAKIKRARFVFNMQDIHPKILIDLGFVKNRFIIKLLSEMEDFVYKKAYNFIVYSEGNKDYLIQKDVEPDNIFIIHNWVDTEFITPSDSLTE